MRSLPQKLLECLEDLEDIYAFDRAEVSQDEVIPLAQAIAKIDRSRL